MNHSLTQLLFIHWGMTFKNQEDYINFLQKRNISIEKQMKWRDEYLEKALAGKCHIIKPRMPLQDNAKYDEWRIHFERYLEYLNDNTILIWSSLWWIFLAKWLSENRFPKKLLSVYLVCPPFDDTLYGEDLVGWFELWDDLSLLEEQSENLTLLFSEDDDCVPISHADKYKEKLPNAKVVTYKSKNWHFNISEFPEIVDMIKEDLH